LIIKATKLERDRQQVAAYATQHRTIVA